MALPEGLRVTLFPTDMSEYTAQVLAGLFELRSRGELVLSVARLPRSAPSAPRSVSLVLNSGGLTRPLRIFIDLNDGCRLLPSAIGSTDVYVKRSLRIGTPMYVAGTRVIPFGLQFSARTAALSTISRIGLHWYSGFRGGRVYSPLERAVAAAQVARRLLLARTPGGAGSKRQLHAIESSGEEGKDAAVFFATRVYAPCDAPRARDREAINGRRVELVRALRVAFGARYVGGLRPSAFALRTYPDCVYHAPDNLGWHFRTGRRALVHVNTAGLHGSTGWKFAEALAQKSCLVTEPTSDVLFPPVVSGVHCLTFDSVAACVAQCATLLEQPARAEAIAHAGHDYYLAHVQPVALMRGLLARAAVVGDEA